MRVVMTLLVRDEADIVESQLAFHLAAGVDFVIATDHRSQDGTTDILRRYEGEGVLRLIRREEEGFRQAEWVTEMARLAAAEYGADWVIHADADEFWWPRGGNLKEVLAAIPPRFGLVFGLWRHFAPRPADGRHFSERMIYRLSPYGPSTEPADPFHPQVKVAHRADNSVRVAVGNHDARSLGLVLLRGWYPLEVLHFPLRSLEQLRSKYGRAAERWRRGVGLVPRHVEAGARALSEGREEEQWRRLQLDDAQAEGQREARRVAVDTRVRDALRFLAGVSELPPRPTFPPPFGLPRLRFPGEDLEASASHADAASALSVIDAQARLERQIAIFEERLARLEGRRWRAGARRATALLGRRR
ncbi:MAG: hypothetical protein C4307_05465 [Chloroflexota bacterium]